MHYDLLLISPPFENEEEHHDSVSRSNSHSSGRANAGRIKKRGGISNKNFNNFRASVEGHFMAKPAESGEGGLKRVGGECGQIVA